MQSSGSRAWILAGGVSLLTYWLCWVFVAGFSLVAAKGGYFLIVAASLVECRFAL